MNDSHPPHMPCVFPAASEITLATVPSPSHESAVRVRVEPGPEGYVRLEQMAHSQDMGWYCQKSFIIPAALLKDVITQLRKADCLLPKSATVHALHDSPLPFRLTPELPIDETGEAQRRDA